MPAQPLAPLPHPVQDSRFALLDHRGEPMVIESRGPSSAEGKNINDLSRMVKEVISGDPIHNERWTDAEAVEKLDHWVFVAVAAIRDAVSRVPLRAFDQQGAEIAKDDPSSDDLVQLMSCDINPLDTRIDLWSWTMTFLELTGNAIWLKVRDGMGLREIWPLPSHRIKPKHEKGRPLVGYTMDVGAGQDITIPVEDIIHIRYPNPSDRFWGMGTLQHAAQAYQAHDNIRASQLAAFSNEILSSLYFHCDGLLDPGQWERMKSSLMERYAGPANAKLPLMLENKTKVDYFNRPPAEMEYQESAAITRDEILAIFGVMPIFAGIVGNANRSNSDVQERIFLGNTIWSRCIRIAERLNKDPELTPDGRTWAFDNPTPKNETEEANRRSKDVNSGVTAANDHREEMGLEPTEWGTYPKWVWEMMLANNLDELTPETLVERNEEARQRAEELAAQLASGESQPGGDDDDDQDEDDRALGGVHTVTRSVIQHRRAGPMQTIIDRARNEQDTLENHATRALRKYFSKQLTRVLANVSRLFDNLPQRDAVGTAQRRVALMLNGSEPCRLYPDGSLVRECGDYLQGRATIGQAVIPEGCLHSSIEMVGVNVRVIDPDQVEQLDDWRGHPKSWPG